MRLPPRLSTYEKFTLTRFVYTPTKSPVQKQHDLIVNISTKCRGQPLPRYSFFPLRLGGSVRKSIVRQTQIRPAIYMRAGSRLLMATSCSHNATI